MNKSTNCSNDEKSSSENFSNISSESIQLDKKFDSKKDSVKPRKRKEDNIRKKIKTSALKAIIKK